MEIRYSEPATVYYGDFDPDGNCVNEFVTEEVNKDSTFGGAILKLVRAEIGEIGYPDVLMTTRQHWSGHSEYTITNQWSEIILTVPACNWEKEWSSLGDFLRALADANPKEE